MSRNVAETVSGRFTGLAAPYNPEDYAYERYEGNKSPAATLAYVVHATPAKSETRQEEGEISDVAYIGEEARHHAEDAEHAAYDEAEESKPPVLCTCGTA